jgi:hypothetical protein
MSKLLDAFAGCELDEPAFIALLTKVMEHSESVQNDPKQGFVPKEGLVAEQLVEILKPYSTENGGTFLLPPSPPFRIDSTCARARTYSQCSCSVILYSLYLTLLMSTLQMLESTHTCIPARRPAPPFTP